MKRIIATVISSTQAESRRTCNIWKRLLTSLCGHENPLKLHVPKWQLPWIVVVKLFFNISSPSQDTIFMTLLHPESRLISSLWRLLALIFLVTIKPSNIFLFPGFINKIITRKYIVDVKNAVFFLDIYRVF